MGPGMFVSLGLYSGSRADEQRTDILKTASFPLLQNESWADPVQSLVRDCDVTKRASFMFKKKF